MPFCSAAGFEACDGGGFGSHPFRDFRLRQTGAATGLQQHIQEQEILSLGVILRFDGRVFEHFFDELFMPHHQPLSPPRIELARFLDLSQASCWIF